jgi:hemerythrin
MVFMEWGHEYETGIEAVDADHRELVDLINDFHDLLVRGGTRTEIIDLFSVVAANISLHFKAEENAMRRIDYPDYRSHKGDHDRLLEEIDKIAHDYEVGKYLNRQLALATRIRDWFDTHFFDMDKKLHRHEQANQVKAEAV